MRCTTPADIFGYVIVFDEIFAVIPGTGYFHQAFLFCIRRNSPQAKGKTVMYLPAEMMEVGEVSAAAKDKVRDSSPPHLRFMTIDSR